MTLTDLDRVRLMVGDTNSDDPLLYDDEIEALISRQQVSFDDELVTNLPAAAADAAGAIAAKFSREFNFAEDGQRFDRAQKVGHYMALEQRLRNRAGGMSVPLGGTTSTTS